MTAIADAHRTEYVPPAPHKPAKRRLTVRGAGYVTVVLALSCACISFFVLMGLTPVEPTDSVVLWALGINGVLTALLIGETALEIAMLIRARKRGRAAARLHIRIVGLFSIVAIVPAIVVAVVASVTLNRGLDHWFSQRTRAIIDTSLSIAQAYADEHARTLKGDILGLKGDFERAQPLLAESPDRFQNFMNSIAALRGVPGVYLVKPDGTMLAQAEYQFSTNFPPPPKDALERAAKSSGEPILIAPGITNVVGAVAKLDNYVDVYLYIAREIDPKVMRYIAETSASVAEYSNLAASRLGAQIAFGLLYLGLALVVLLSAIWLGIGFANRLVAPIRQLIDAADEIGRGNLEVTVPFRSADGDLGALGATFNTMAAELRTQRAEIVAASEQIDARRRFSEAVLAGVSAGVVGTDATGVVTIANRGALRLLANTASDVLGKPIVEVAPELRHTVEAALNDSYRPEHRDQVSIVRAGRERAINVRVTTEESDTAQHGYVITLDDITDLVTAQRSSAWADVARRIAHEIKNPLTPIQLSAERLKRRFGKNITEGREVFDQCTDTIIRQVGDIGRMVDEFSSFARMPKPAFEERNIGEAAREAVFLMEVAHPDIAFEIDMPEEPMMGRFDPRLISQVFTNLVKNASEAITALDVAERGTPKITVRGRVEGENNIVEVIDTGIGLPVENRHRLLEPYMTTREKGTGLGLAIVTKIVEEHGGHIELLDSPEVAHGGRGAMVRITLPHSARRDGDAPVNSPQA
ncbi:PAS domain-containing sensor histidine kinase [Kaistia dalseonensis]|uniref:histidine kinase n=1 Tax=Kaistia dalseonensis TaxID=410840 RepID=A0ABU0H319_9HYPH|nr:PAS domain-containing sensor histidine kinase [Kaistia dalseonensis]MCX5494101.1 PAS domain-containing sensor histidine kinase [Kaistia dalseonensis]MDQ0436680.1 two-component system nitrogen regulation sensor histidine kinase NtrY [Kaistia dalseonensis]